jgi:type IV secretion system protein VirB2
MEIDIMAVLENGITRGKKKEKKFKRKLMILFAVFALFGLLLVFSEGIAEAGTESTLPWEAPLKLISGSLTGPVAKSLCLIMVIVSVGVLIFGGDLAGWARSVCFMTLAAGVIGGAETFIGLFSVTGSLIV